MSAGPGVVYLVGAGPGDPGLMTTRSLDLIVAADVIVHDRLIPRDAASAVASVTGHEDPEKEDSALDYEALAKFPGTLVFYMGVKALPRIAEALIAAGRDGSEPAAVVERGTLPGQRTVDSTLEG